MKPGCEQSFRCHLPLMKAWVFVVSMCGMGLAMADKPVKVGVDEAVDWMGKTGKVQVVDVRSAEEYAEGHLKGAVRVTWSGEELEKQALAKLAKDKPMLVYCRSGRRSTAAADFLSKLGFEVIRNLEGGILAWQKAGKPVEKCIET